MATTKVRAFRIGDDPYDAAVARSRQPGEPTLTEVVRAALASFAAGSSIAEIEREAAAGRREERGAASPS